MLSDLPAAIYTRLKLPLLIKSSVCSGFAQAVFSRYPLLSNYFSVPALLVVMFAAFKSVCLCRYQVMGVGVAKHLTNVLQMKSVYWFVCRHGNSSITCRASTHFLITVIHRAMPKSTCVRMHRCVRVFPRAEACPVS